MGVLAHGNGIDDLLMVAVPVVFILVYRLFRGPAPPDDDRPDHEPGSR